MKKKENLACPICGSLQVDRHEIINRDQLTLGPIFFFNEIYYQCESCYEKVDILNETDQNYILAKKQAEMVLVKDIIMNLSYLGISMAYFERAFELPIRTLTRWKNGDFSATALALLRIVATYPWLAYIAEQRFEDSVSCKFSLEHMQTTKFNYQSDCITTGGFGILSIGA